MLTSQAGVAEWLCNRLQTGLEEFDSLSLLLKNNAMINAGVAEWLCNRLQTGSGEFDSLPLLSIITSKASFSWVDTLPDGRSTRPEGGRFAPIGPPQALSSVFPYRKNAHYPAIMHERSARRSIGMMAD